MKEEFLDDAIKDLPGEQIELVKSCFKYATTPCKGRRYTLKWVYECIIMKMKSTKLYKHLRSHNILPLPSLNLFNSYVQRIGSAYGFNISTFEAMAKKAENLPREERSGLRKF